MLYGSFYLAGALNEKPLVALRSDLRALGLERPETVDETEDHIASLCEVMRYLIAGDDLGVSNLATQQRFFDAPSAAAGSMRSATLSSASARRLLSRRWRCSRVISSPSRRRGSICLTLEPMRRQRRVVHGHSIYPS